MCLRFDRSAIGRLLAVRMKIPPTSSFPLLMGQDIIEFVRLPAGLGYAIALPAGFRKFVSRADSMNAQRNLCQTHT